MTGRPSDYSEALGDLICEKLSDGESLRAICSAEEMPHRATVFRWLASNETFRDQYARAREAQADTIFDECLDIADDKSADTKIVGEDGREVCNTEFVQRAKLRIDTRKWMAGKLRPKVYGDKLTQEHTGPDGGPVQVSTVRRVIVEPNTRDTDR